MKKFIFNEMLIYSPKERRAKKVKFDPIRTLIYGKNDTGKSSLIKTLFMTFGAIPQKVNDKWKRLDAISLVKFAIDENQYSILKHGKHYCIFDENEEVLNSFNSITKGLAPFLAELTNFKLKLPDTKGNSIIPTPLFIFLPFYIDQDSSWLSNWNAFSGMSQFKQPRDPIIYFHTGIKGNEYYEAKSQIAVYKEKIEELTRERKLTSSILSNVKEKFPFGDFNIDVDEFKEEINELLGECQELKNLEQNLKEKLIDLNTKKIITEDQIQITQQAQNEANSDYKFASEKLDHLIECPTCGAEYENSFGERFEIAQDSDRCAELLSDLFNELQGIKGKIESENNALSKTISEIEKIEKILQRKKGEVLLRDVIENAGKNEVRKVFGEKIAEITNQITNNAKECLELEEKIKQLENKKRTNSILTTYRSHIEKNLKTLEVSSLSEKEYKKITTRVKDTGSSLPRALIAYYFSIFETIKAHSSSVYCPIVIDSPNQQAQDIQHIDKILNFINENQPTETQMILGLEELYNLDFGCPIIELKEKYHLLQESEHEEVRNEIEPFIQKMFQQTGFIF